MINLAIRDDPNVHTGHMKSCITSFDIAGPKNVYVNNFLQKRGEALDKVSLCLSCQDASADMQYDLPG